MCDMDHGSFKFYNEFNNYKDILKKNKYPQHQCDKNNLSQLYSNYENEIKLKNSAYN